MLDSALGWIGKIADWVGQFVPRWQLLDPSQAAVKNIGWSLRFWRFKEPRIVFQRRGLVFHWPLVSEVYVWPVAMQVNSLQAQTIETTDNKTFVVAGLVSYEVEDLQTLLLNASDADDTIRDIALGAIQDACCQYSSDELRAANRNGRLGTAMRQEARARLKPLGVKVLNVRLTDLAPGRVLRLVSSQPTERGLG